MTWGCRVDDLQTGGEATSLQCSTWITSIERRDFSENFESCLCIIVFVNVVQYNRQNRMDSYGKFPIRIDGPINIYSIPYFRSIHTFHIWHWLSGAKCEKYMVYSVLCTDDVVFSIFPSIDWLFSSILRLYCTAESDHFCITRNFPAEYSNITRQHS